MKFRSVLLLLFCSLLAAAAPREFTIGKQLWRCYSKGKVLRISANEFRVIDAVDKNGAGLVCTLPVKRGERLSFSGKFKALKGDVDRLFIQIRFMPRRKIVQQEYSLKFGEDYKTVSLNFPTVPTGCTQAMVYVYVQPGKNEFLMRDLKLEPLQTQKFDAAKLKARRKFMTLDAQTLLVLPADGSIDAAVENFLKNSPVKFKVVKTLPAKGDHSSCIIVGNRNNNKLISDLYDRYYLIADSYYPGRGGYQLRTLFDPDNSNRDYLLVSGSSTAETLHALQLLQKKLPTLEFTGGKLKLPFFWDVKISDKHKLPLNIVKASTFDESEGYGTRFFGWNVLARYMALFYATGDEKYARRFLELAFLKNSGAKAELARDPGTFKLVNDPIAGPYHYNAAMMNLYWAMIEDHPVFSDKEREQVAEAMFRQFLFWRDTSNGCNVYNYFSPAAMVGNRHGQWAAVSLYTAARYLNKVMPANEYIHAQKAAENFFDSIKKYYYVQGEGGNLTWFPSGNEPVPFFMLLAGWKDSAEQSALPDLYKALETLCGNEHGRRIRYYVPLGMLRRIAYLLDDNAPVEMEKRLASHFKSNTFRLGQSFAPAQAYSKNRGTKVQQWNFIKPSSVEKVQWRMPFKDTENGFSIASWRQDDKRGDLLIIDGHLDKINRQPLHAMTIFTLALDNMQLLAGYRNQLWARHDGLSFSSMPGSAHFEYASSVGSNAGFASSLDISESLKWQRSLLKLEGLCLAADTLTEKSSEDKTYSIDAIWEFAPGLQEKLFNDHQISLTSTDLEAASTFYFGALSSFYTVQPAAGEIIRLSGGVPAILFKAQQAGEKLTIDFILSKAFSGNALLRMYAFKDRGKFNVYIDNKLIKSQLDHYAAAAGAMNFDLGNIKLAAGRHTLTLEAAGASRGGNMSIAFSSLAMLDSNAAVREGSLSFSDPAAVRLEAHKATVNDLLSGKVAVYTFRTRLQPGKPRTFFTLIASRPARDLDICRLDDSTALLKIPHRALAVYGQYAELNIRGKMVLLSPQELCGMKITQAGDLFSSPQAVDIKWDLAGGDLEISSPAAVSVKAAGRTLQLAAGINKFKCPVSAELRKAVKQKLDALPWQKKTLDRNANTLSGKPRAFTASCKLNNYPASMISFNDLLAVSCGKNIRLMTLDLKTVRTLTADAEVGKLAYAADSGLLLAGCADGKVTAFDPASGKRIWEYASVQAEGLQETGANWYLKSSFPGIYGLKAGKFINGQENIFVGSASTLEVLDSRGKLLRREKIFWGPVQHLDFLQLKNKPHILMSQLYPGSDYLTRFDTAFNKKIGYNTPPVGRLHFPSWMGINRTNITVCDLDKNGEVMVVSGLNGIWNRIIVWSADGKPLREVSFGPGDTLKVPPYGRERMVKRFLYDTVVIRNDQRNYIAGATCEALILFDNQLKKLWSRLLPSEPLFTAAGKHMIASGLRNGQLCFYDLQGNLKNVNRNPHPWAAMLVKDNILFAADSEGNIYKFILQ